MKNAFRNGFIAAAAAAASLVSVNIAAQGVKTDAYWTSSAAGGQIWKNPYGECWRTIEWTPAKAIAECDPDLVRKPAPVAARAPEPAPAPAVVPAPPPPAPAPAPVAAAPAVAAPAPAAPAPIRDVVVLKGVNFATNSARLTPESTSVLDEVVAALQKRTEIRAEVAGHTDNRGTPAANQKLSQARAESVRTYLVSKGVAADRLTARGYGQDSPIADNKTENGRATNRRVELRALK